LQHFRRLRPLLQHGCLFSQQGMIEMPSVFAAAQQGLQAEKREE